MPSGRGGRWPRPRHSLLSATTAAAAASSSRRLLLPLLLLAAGASVFLAGTFLQSNDNRAGLASSAGLGPSAHSAAGDRRLLGPRRATAWARRGARLSTFAAKRKKGEESKYGNSVNLPVTGFQQRAQAPKREPEIQKLWEDLRVYETLAKNNPGPEFTLHDGPPYANGDLHIGHALNKILKDVINRYRTLKGDKVNYVPGWDCHGLPIELKVLQSLSSSERKGLTPLEIRKKAKEFALETVGKQRESFKRYGVWADWGAPYLTLQPEYEAAQMAVFAEMLKNGHIYRGRKPVHWSPSSRTALAEAELEYPEGHVSRSIYVAFRVTAASEALEAFRGPEPSSLELSVWTTTPWTMPANQAVAVNGELDYAVVEHEEAIGKDRRLVVAEGLVEALGEQLGLGEGQKLTVVGKVKGEELVGTRYQHPLYGQKEESPVVVGGDYITTESGTGLVHTAPGHGQEDYETGLKYGLEMLSPVDDAGRFTDEAGERFAGMSVLKEGNEEIIKALEASGALLSVYNYTHKYPYDWRTKKPTIFRATSQWFASVAGFRESVLEAIDAVKWVPGTGINRMRSFCESRGDWCISRQRAWGVPIPVFYDTASGEPLMDQDTIQHVIGIVKERGTDAWWELDAPDLLPERYKAEAEAGKWRKGTDTMDVWFDSGTSWAGVVNGREELAYPADVYFEGSDQHRGWFQSSLLTSVASKGSAPYKTVLTHGFVLDEHGRKMSKSVGNVVDPRQIIEGGKDLKKNPPYGADVLRLWASSVDFKSDVSIGAGIISQTADSYRKIRNTFRYMIGNLYDFDGEEDAVPYDDLPRVDRYILGRLAAVMEEVDRAYGEYDFANVVQTLTRFCVADLSNYYLDLAKDRLYISKPDSPRRRSCQTVLHTLLESLTQAVAPILPHLAEDLYQNTPDKKFKSVFERPLEVPQFEADTAGDERIELARRLRNDVNKVLEEARQAKLLGASSEAEVFVFTQDAETLAALEQLQRNQNEVDELKYLLMVSGVRLADEGEVSNEEKEGMLFSSQFGDAINTESGVRVGVQKHQGQRCERCWNYFDKESFSADHPSFPDVCFRCLDALEAKDAKSVPGVEMHA